MFDNVICKKKIKDVFEIKTRYLIVIEKVIVFCVC